MLRFMRRLGFALPADYPAFEVRFADAADLNQCARAQGEELGEMSAVL